MDPQLVIRGLPTTPRPISCHSPHAHQCNLLHNGFLYIIIRRYGPIAREYDLQEAICT